MNIVLLIMCNPARTEYFIFLNLCSFVPNFKHKFGAYMGMVKYINNNNNNKK
jgi:hypothetical protein